MAVGQCGGEANKTPAGKQEKVERHMLRVGRSHILDATRNPKNGTRITGHTFEPPHLGRYSFMLVRSSTCADWRLRYSATMSARPTATSAAATVMMKNTITWPLRLSLNREKETSARFAELSISSSDIYITRRLRRTRTPSKPSAKSSALTIR